LRAIPSERAMSTLMSLAIVTNGVSLLQTN
jgi:hypothetical protein